MGHLVTTERRGIFGDILVVTMQDQKRLNQLSLQMMAELEETFEFVRDSRDITMVILTGGEVFCAGARIQELHEVAKTRDAKQIREFISRANRMANLIEDCGKETTALIGKYCFGGGNELAMACTTRDVTGPAQFGQQEIKHGIMPGMGGTQRLPRLVGIEEAMPILLGGEPFSAEEARRIGLIGTPGPAAFYPHEGGVTPYIVEDELDRFFRSDRYAELSTKAEISEAFPAIIEAVREGMKRPLREGLEIEQELFVNVMMSDSAQQGLQRTIDRLTKKPKE